MLTYAFGPFRLVPGRRTVLLNDAKSIKQWHLFYGDTELAMRSLDTPMMSADIRGAFATDIGGFVRRAQTAHAPKVLELIEQASDMVLARISVSDWPDGFADTMPNNQHPYWLMDSEQTCMGMPVTLQEFAAIAVECAYPTRAWIAGLLPDEVLTLDPALWRAPTSWEIRHVVGEGSLTGLSGAKAAELVGVTPQNFRKYTAADDAKSRQAISFAMWHLLLRRLDIVKG